MLIRPSLFFMIFLFVACLEKQQQNTPTNFSVTPDLSPDIDKDDTNPVLGGQSGSGKADDKNGPIIDSVDCPDGYISVPGNSNLGTDDFCVMKYEAKIGAAGEAVSNAQGQLLRGLNLAEAKAKCEELNTLHGVQNQYRLITNKEWMTIARNAENVDVNWSGGAVGAGCLNRGNQGMGLYPNASAFCAYGNGQSEIGLNRNPLAKLTLSNDEEVWDLAGNVYEWVDFNKTCSKTDWLDLPDVNCSQLEYDDYQTYNGTYTHQDGVGMLKGGNGQAVRGGYWNAAHSGGVFSLNFCQDADIKLNSIGFRCTKSAQ